VNLSGEPKLGPSEYLKYCSCGMSFIAGGARGGDIQEQCEKCRDKYLKSKQEVSMKYFKMSEFNCKETGENEMDIHFLRRLDRLRELCKFPFVINSGFRSKKHSVEKVKSMPGTHTMGIAADVKVLNASQRYKLLKHAYAMGFKGIGIAKGFVHVDDRVTESKSWIY